MGGLACQRNKKQNNFLFFFPRTDYPGLRLSFSCNNTLLSCYHIKFAQGFKSWPFDRPTRNAEKKLHEIFGIKLQLEMELKNTIFPDSPDWVTWVE